MTPTEFTKLYYDYLKLVNFCFYKGATVFEHTIKINDKRIYDILQSKSIECSLCTTHKVFNGVATIEEVPVMFDIKCKKNNKSIGPTINMKNAKFYKFSQKNKEYLYFKLERNKSMSLKHFVTFLKTKVRLDHDNIPNNFETFREENETCINRQHKSNNSTNPTSLADIFENDQVSWKHRKCNEIYISKRFWDAAAIQNTIPVANLRVGLAKSVNTYRTKSGRRFVHYYKVDKRSNVKKRHRKYI